MNQLKLDKPPIIEAVVDIDCDMPSGFDLDAMENVARENLRADYPKFRKKLREQHQIKTGEGKSPSFSTTRALEAFQFLKDDAKQLVQIRREGFSFNRLAPYSSLDDYFAEIERTWKIYLKLVSPVQIRSIRLRYINRILLPVEPEGTKLEKYFKISPQLPDDKLVLGGFLNQYVATEIGTGNHVVAVLTGLPQENNFDPFLFDITAQKIEKGSIEDWAWLLTQVMSLRGLVNRIFRNTLTDACLNLFRQQ